MKTKKSTDNNFINNLKLCIRIHVHNTISSVFSHVIGLYVSRSRLKYINFIVNYFGSIY